MLLQIIHAVLMKECVETALKELSIVFPSTGFLLSAFFSSYQTHIF